MKKVSKKLPTIINKLIILKNLKETHFTDQKMSKTSPLGVGGATSQLSESLVVCPNFLPLLEVQSLILKP